MATDERIEKMEQELARVRRFNHILMACIILSLGSWFILKTFGPETAWAQSDEKVLRAKRFVLEDENGMSMAVLTMFKYGPRLTLADANGKSRATFSVEKDKPVLSCTDENGKVIWSAP